MASFWMLHMYGEILLCSRMLWPQQRTAGHCDGLPWSAGLPGLIITHQSSLYCQELYPHKNSFLQAAALHY